MQEELMTTSRRAAGLGLLAYGIGTPLAFSFVGAPGGTYHEEDVRAFISSDHWASAFAWAYVGLFASLGLLVFADRMRHELRSGGGILWGLAVGGTAAAVVGWFLAGGVAVAFAEGGPELSAVPLPVVYTLTEMGNLVAVCASAFLVGSAALVLAARASLSTPLRTATAVAGVCGLLAAFFWPIGLFWLWAIGFGAWLLVTGAREIRPVPVEPLSL
jgi:hypothetical protein